MAEFGIQPGNGALGKWITVFIKQIPEFAIDVYKRQEQYSIGEMHTADVETV